ncbi:MAG TPA: glycosyltransferase family 39 protein [Bacteroidota bacterium]|nr:glycosyltransferase family 39 protein [Bacteroidota bacterium]
MTDTTAKRKTTLAIFASGLLALTLQLGLLLNGFYGISADESGRTLDAYTWLKTGTPYSDVWLPFHRIVVAVGLFLWNDTILVPRIISFVFGCVVLLAIILMAHELFHNHRVTMVTAFLAALFPPRIILSVVPLTEIEFIAFILVGLIAYIRWLQSKKPWQLVATSACIGIGTTIRYEAWIIAVVFALLLLTKREYRTLVFTHSIFGSVLLFLIAIFPLYWTAIKFQETHRILSFASSHADRYQRVFHIDTMKIIWHNPVTQFVYQNGLSLNLIGMLSIVPCFRFDRQKRAYLLLPIIALFIFALVLLTGAGFTTHNPWRISVLWGCLLLPFTAYWMVQYIAHHETSNIVKRYGVLMLVGVAFLVQLLWLSRAPEFTSSDYEAGKILKKELQQSSQGKILLETPDWNFVNVLVAAGVPDSVIFNTGFDPYEPAGAVLSTKNVVDVERLTRLRIHLLVFRSPLLFSQAQARRVTQLYHTPRWTVYKVQ